MYVSEWVQSLRESHNYGLPCLLNPSVMWGGRAILVSRGDSGDFSLMTQALGRATVRLSERTVPKRYTCIILNSKQKWKQGYNVARVLRKATRGEGQGQWRECYHWLGRWEKGGDRKPKSYGPAQDYLTNHLSLIIVGCQPSQARDDWEHSW